MITINKHTKLNNHKAPLPINDGPITKQMMFKGVSCAKSLLKDVNVAHFFQTTTALSAGA